MIQNFIRAGARQFTVLTCAAVALATAGVASADPMPDVRSEAIAMGIDLDAAPVDLTTPLRRAGSKRGGTVLWDNGDHNNINGLASELNTIVTDSRVADDFVFTAALTTVNHAVARLYNSASNNGRLEIYRNNTSGGACTPARPFTGNPPLFIFNSTDVVTVGFGFGFNISEWEWQTPTLILTAGTYWACPIVVGTGGGRGFLCTSFGGPSGGGPCLGAWRSTFFGVPDWTPSILNSNYSFRLYGTPTPTGGGGDCDLTPIEEKLDDETRFTDDTELGDLQVIIESRASQASVDALEAKADAMQLSLDLIQNTLCDVIRLLHTPNGLRSATCNGVDYEWNGLQGGGGD